MPRTKVSKSSKRNRETTNLEEKVREFENSLDCLQNALDVKLGNFMNAYENEVKLMLQRAPRALLKMKMVDVFSLVCFKLLASYQSMHYINLFFKCFAGFKWFH